MSTKTEPYRKYVAHDEKSKFFIFLPEIAYGKPRNVMGLFFLKYFHKSQIRFGPMSGQNHTKFSDLYLTTNFALFNHNNTPVWAQNIIVEEFTSLLRPIILLWVNFEGHNEPLKITKSFFLKILNYARFFHRQIRYPVKQRITNCCNILKEEMSQ